MGKRSKRANQLHEARIVRERKTRVVREAAGVTSNTRDIHQQTLEARLHQASQLANRQKSATGEPLVVTNTVTPLNSGRSCRGRFIDGSGFQVVGLEEGSVTDVTLPDDTFLCRAHRFEASELIPGERNTTVRFCQVGTRGCAVLAQF